MDFLSSRAKALRQHFVPGQRSLSDTWQNTATAYLTDDPRMTSPDLGGSMLSLLDEPDAPWQPNYEVPTTAVKSQRSRSLDSLGSVPVTSLNSLIAHPCPPVPTTASTTSTHIPRPRSQPPPPQLPPLVTFMSNVPGSTSSLTSNYNCLQPKTHDPPYSPIRFSATAPTTPIRLSASGIQNFLDLSAPISKKYPDSIIPKIPGPPSSPKHSRPTTPRAIPSSPLSFKYEDSSIIPEFPGRTPSPKSSQTIGQMNLEPKFCTDLLHSPSSPNFARFPVSKQSETIKSDSFIIPKIPGPPPSPKHFRPTSPRNVDYLCSESLPGSSLLRPEKARPFEVPSQLAVICDDNAFSDAYNYSSSLSNPAQIPQRGFKRSATLPSRGGESRYLLKTSGNPPTVIPRKKESSPSTLQPVTKTRVNLESESFDHEENLDTVAESCLSPVRPTIFEARTRPKLKHQWSMDESRTKEVGIISLPRQPVDPSTSTAAPTKTAEKRRRFFMRKQTNSAPDSFEGPPHLSVSKSKEHHSVSFCLGSVRKCRGSDCSILQPNLPEIKLEPEPGVEHLADLRYPGGDPPCHFCNQQASTSIHDGNRLKIVSGGLIQSRDGSCVDSNAHYMNLPSPNFSEGDHDSSYTHSAYDSDSMQLVVPGRQQKEVLSAEEEDVEEKPPPSALTRRPALVPFKLESASTSKNESADGKTRNRSSSIVVIPPMQICPGDLVVYSKFLTNRNSLLEINGSSSSLSVTDTDVNARKGKSWNIMRLFERGNREKNELLPHLPTALENTPCTLFVEEQLSRYRGMHWCDFVHLVAQASTPSSSGSSSPDVLSPPPPPPPPLQPSPSLKKKTKTNLMQALITLPKTSLFKGMDRGIPLRPTPLESSTSVTEPLVSPVSTTSRAEYKRREAIWDLYQSECAFLFDHLMVLNNAYLEPLKDLQVRGYLMFAEPRVLFGNLEELGTLATAFCKDFLVLLLNNVGASGELDTTDIIVKLYKEHSGASSISAGYHAYAMNYENAVVYLDTLRHESDFKRYEAWCNQDIRCKKLKLTDLLVAPVQHLMRVPLVLREIEMKTEDLVERQQIHEIIEIEESGIRRLDKKIDWLKNFERLLELQRNLEWPTVFELDPKIYVPEFLKSALTRQPCERIIVSPRRKIIIEGPLQLWDTGKAQDVHVIIFDDMLLITRKKKGLSKKKSSLAEGWASSCGRGSTSTDTPIRYVVYKQPLSLDRFFVHDVKPSESASSRLDAAFVLVNLNRFQQVTTVHTFQAPTDLVKQTWLLRLKDTQATWKSTIHSTMGKQKQDEKKDKPKPKKPAYDARRKNST